MSLGCGFFFFFFNYFLGCDYVWDVLNAVFIYFISICCVSRKYLKDMSVALGESNGMDVDSDDDDQEPVMVHVSKALKSVWGFESFREGEPDCNGDINIISIFTNRTNLLTSSSQSSSTRSTPRHPPCPFGSINPSRHPHRRRQIPLLPAPCLDSFACRCAVPHTRHLAHHLAYAGPDQMVARGIERMLLDEWDDGECLVG